MIYFPVETFKTQGKSNEIRIRAGEVMYFPLCKQPWEKRNHKASKLGIEAS